MTKGIRITIDTNDALEQHADIVKALLQVQSTQAAPVILRMGETMYLPNSDGLGAYKAKSADVGMHLDRYLAWGEEEVDRGHDKNGKPRAPALIPVKLDSSVKATLMSRLPKEFWEYTGTSAIPLVLPETPENSQVTGRRYRLLTTPGYDRPTGLYYNPPESLADVAALRGEWDDAHHAYEFLRNNWIHDFEFKSAEDEAHWLAMICHPFLQRLLWRAPCYVVEANDVSTGKSLLVQLLMLVAMGEAPGLPWPEGESEIQRTILGAMLKSPAIALVDNLKVELQSSGLEVMLTSGKLQGRVIGVSDVATVTNHSAWVFTVNNGEIGRDMRERSVQIRLVKSAAARRGKGFFHRHIEDWTRQERARIISAILTVIAEPLLMPGYVDHDDEDAPVFSKFSEWRDLNWVIGRNLGLTSLLATDRQQVAITMVDEALRAFYKVCVLKFANRDDVGTTEVAELASLLAAGDNPLFRNLPFVTVSTDNRVTPTEADIRKVGIFLARNEGTSYAGYCAKRRMLNGYHLHAFCRV